MIADFLQNPARAFTFWKGRVALYTILKAMGVGPGNEVILPGYTCVVVPNAVMYLGARPVYADVDPQTYNISLDTIRAQVSDRTRAILVQNTYGLSPDIDPINSFAREKGIWVVEDCAHGLGATYKGRPAGTNTHAAFFSSQWSKPISTGLGGLAYIRDDDLARKVAEMHAKMPKPSALSQSILTAQVWIRPLADNPALYYSLVGVYRWLTQNLGLSVGSSVGGELNSTVMPADYLCRMGGLQAKKLLRELANLARSLQIRQKNAAYYDRYFLEKGMDVPYRPEYATHGMLRYAVRVPDKAAFLQRAMKHKIPVGDWFVSPLHPVEGDLSQWMYTPGQCPEAEKACAETINLFTEKPLPEKALDALFG